MTCQTYDYGPGKTSTGRYVKRRCRKAATVNVNGIRLCDKHVAELPAEYHMNGSCGIDAAHSSEDHLKEASRV